MARIYGEPGSEWGDKQVYEALKFLPEDCIVYAQPTLVYKEERRHPDYVIVYPEWGGVIVLEVKDWIEVVDRDRYSARVHRSNGEIKKENSPLGQARTAALVLSNMLEADQDLQDYAGRRNYAYAYGCVFPHFPPTVIQWLEEAWGKSYLLGQADLKREQISAKIAGIYVPPGARRGPLTERQVRAICAIIDGRNKNVDRTTGEFKGVYDRAQESLYKEPIVAGQEQTIQNVQPVQIGLDLEPEPALEARIQQLEREVPEEAKRLKSTQYVRLVRGFAGTGKTDVLILRAHYLHEQYPDLEILVTTFNDPVYRTRLEPELRSLKPRVDVIKFDTLCADIYQQKHGRWNVPQDTLGLINKMAGTGTYSLIDELGSAFIAEEFIWMKETGRIGRQSYIEQHREGRGGSRRRNLSIKVKEQIFDLFEAYQQELQDIPAYDWVDLHEKTWRYLKAEVRPQKMYDVILIDEAQHFAPTWMQIIQEFLKPGGTLFICDDPSQSVYRYYSWRQKGVDVVGRTRWLRVPYRNTRQIFEAAYALIADNPLAQKLLAENGEAVLPDLDSTVIKEGPLPQIHHFPSWEAERQFVASEISQLVQKQGVAPREIGILHEKKHVLDRYKPVVPQGVQFYEVKRQTGLEYKIVFVPRVQEMIDRTLGASWAEDEGRQRLKFYMTMTRARQQVYLLYQQNWPTLLEPIRPYANWVMH